MKRLFILIALLSLLCLSYQPVKKPQQAPRNPEYQRWVARNIMRVLNRTPIETGIVPNKADESHVFAKKPVVDVPRYIPTSADGGNGDPTAALDWRDNGGNFVSAIKNQGTCSSCWIFAQLADLESQLLIGGFPSWTLSEENHKECNCWRNCLGANNYSVFSYLTLHGIHLDDSGSQSGEAYVDDPDPPCNRDNPYLQKIIVTGWRSVNNASVAILQGDIETYGPLKSNVDSSKYANTAECVCNQDEASTNHSVLIVGWDDNMSCTYQTDGACSETGGWIVKNHSGTGFGDNGFFYISYSSAGIGTGTFRIVSFKYADPEEIIYAYDEGGRQDVYGYPGGETPTIAYGLCKFTADRDITIEAIDVYATANTTNFTVYLYDSFDGTDLGSLLTSENYGPTSRSGYYSIPLSSPQSFKSGDQIIVVVKATTTGYNYPIAVDDTNTAYCGIESGKTFLSETAVSGTWTDASTLGTPSDVALRCRGRFRASKHSKATSSGGKIIKK